MEGIPAGLDLTADFINQDLARRQLGFGRGGRMKIETDRAEILSGVRHGVTIGSPIALLINNRDWQNWSEEMSPDPVEAEFERAVRPRPGHADLTGLLKTDQKDIRNILERASARETAARVALGAVAKRLLEEIGVVVISHVVQIGSAQAEPGKLPNPGDLGAIDASPVRCYDSEAGFAMVEEIKDAARNKDTIGGVFEVIAFNCPPGLGSYIQWDRRLNADICRAVAGIPAIKGVEIGAGFALGGLRGSMAHDEILYDAERGYNRSTNRAGGIEGGMSNGEPIIVKAVMKPIPTLGAGLRTVNMETKEEATAISERSDICAVPAAAVIGEAAVALELAKAALEKFGGDSVTEFLRNYRGYMDHISAP
jgi:chorismate synthase